MSKTSAGVAAAQIPLLVIEDEPSVQAFLKAALEKHGFTVIIASSGAKGLQMLQEQEFQAVISDMRTPGGVNGWDVHEWIRTHRPGLASRVLFITGDILNDETLQALRKTGVPCIEKPFRVMELVTATKKLLKS